MEVDSDKCDSGHDDNDDESGHGDESSNASSSDDDDNEDKDDDSARCSDNDEKKEEGKKDKETSGACQESDKTNKLVSKTMAGGLVISMMFADETETNPEEDLQEDVKEVTEIAEPPLKVTESNEVLKKDLCIEQGSKTAIGISKDIDNYN